MVAQTGGCGCFKDVAGCNDHRSSLKRKKREQPSTLPNGNQEFGSSNFWVSSQYLLGGSIFHP
jgi:hypothetical protein